MRLTMRDHEQERMRNLAERVHRAWLRYQERHPGRSVPITDTLSRILEHAPHYARRRTSNPTRSNRRPLTNPGVFTVQEMAESLETTVGALLGEPGYRAPRDVLTRDQRRTLRDALRILTDLFDLSDP
ncbi:MAG TPA: hypothetical protein VEU30_06140 [Thermoanaerobaculia bacterium]|nr:hypothetical protein [Thermoanaerobaculia bacterium]